MTKGIFYGLGIGPGDPELMTIKAVRVIKENNVIAIPASRPEDSVAYGIAEKAVPEIKNKVILPVPMPMTNDSSQLSAAHISAADSISEYLDKGENVVYITLGDPSLYSSFGYLQKLLSDMGHKTQMISGIPSFIAAAARFNIPLVQGDEPLHIFPDIPSKPAETDGSIVLMKRAAGKDSNRSILSGREIYCAENCGMENERLFRHIPEEKTGYFTIILSKNKKGSTG